MELVKPVNAETKMCFLSFFSLVAGPGQMLAGQQPCIQSRCQAWRIVEIEQVAGEDGLRETSDCVFVRAAERMASDQSG